MVNLTKALFGTTLREHHDRSSQAGRRLLPHHANEDIPSGVPPKRVTQIAIRLKYLVEETIPCELSEWDIIRPHSPIITKKVIELARNAGGHDDRSCIVYCLLVCMRWFKRQALKELYDADLDQLRATTCQIIAKRIIEDTEDQDFCFQELLVKRFGHLQNGKPTMSMSAIERSVDLHATHIIGSSGYQKCIKYLWEGKLVQDDTDATQFTYYKHLADEGYWPHFNPDRMRAPAYQNAFQIMMSFIYLALYTGSINTQNPDGDLDVIEGILYIFTLGFIMDEISKFWKVGIYYLGFWNIFNSSLYALLITSFVTRMIALSKHVDSSERNAYNVLSYNFLAFTAPMFWIRILLYLDSYRAFGAMLVILKKMFQESFIFFALLIVVMIGYELIEHSSFFIPSSSSIFPLSSILLLTFIKTKVNPTNFPYQKSSVSYKPSQVWTKQTPPPQIPSLGPSSKPWSMPSFKVPNLTSSPPFPHHSALSSTTSSLLSSWSFSSTFLSLYSTVPTKTSPTMQLTNTWRYLLQKLCNSFEHQTKMFFFHRLTLLKSFCSFCRLNGG